MIILRVIRRGARSVVPAVPTVTQAVGSFRGGVLSPGRRMCPGKDPWIFRSVGGESVTATSLDVARLRREGRVRVCPLGGVRGFRPRGNPGVVGAFLSFETSRTGHLWRDKWIALRESLPLSRHKWPGIGGSRSGEETCHRAPCNPQTTPAGGLPTVGLRVMSPWFSPGGGSGCRHRLVQEVKKGRAAADTPPEGLETQPRS